MTNMTRDLDILCLHKKARQTVDAPCQQKRYVINISIQNMTAKDRMAPSILKNVHLEG